MRVLQLMKRSVLTLAAAGAVVSGCGDSSPDIPFNPAGTSADLEAVNATFESPIFASFSNLSLLFDAAVGAPMISASSAAMDLRAGTMAGLRAAAVRSAQRLTAIMPSASKESLSASVAAIPAEIAGKTFVYDVGTSAYVVSDLPPLASNKVRFMLYALDPVTFAPAQPLVEAGYVDITDLSSGSTSAARVEVISGTTTYLDYTVSVTSTTSSGRVSMFGFITDGTNRATINLRSTLTFSAGLTLTYSIDVPTRDVSIDLTMSTSGFDPETGAIEIWLDMRGPNGWIALSGEFTTSGGTLSVRNNGDLFATITFSGGSEPVITGAGGQPLTDEEVEALGGIFDLTGEAFTSFDQLFAPVGGFLQPAT
ncbi:MAG: hypothetical protein ACREMZ_08065 [Gemmatimonadales bacterium]